MRKVTILVPAYNEEESLPLFYKELLKVTDGTLSGQYDFQFLFINDGSSDATPRIIRELRVADSRVCVIDMARNFGKEAGMLAGFDYAEGECVITIDADLQEPPEIIPAMLAEWEKGAEDVYGRRRKRNQSRLKKYSSRLYHRILAGIGDVDLHDDAGDFRLLDRKCIDAIRRMRESQRYTKGMYGWIGFRKAAVDYDIRERVAGHSKWSPAKLVKLALDGITSHSVVPLRAASYLGLIVSAIAFIFLIWVLVKAIVWGDPVAGYPSLMAVILFLGGMVLLALGIIGEYLGRIFVETKHRPVYIISNTEGLAQTAICSNSDNESQETHQR